MEEFILICSTQAQSCHDLKLSGKLVFCWKFWGDVILGCEKTTRVLPVMVVFAFAEARTVNMWCPVVMQTAFLESSISQERVCFAVKC